MIFVRYNRVKQKEAKLDISQINKLYYKCIISVTFFSLVSLVTISELNTFGFDNIPRRNVNSLRHGE